MENRAIIKPVSYQVTDGLCFKGLSFNVEFSSTVNSESGERCENIECDTPRTVLFLHGWLDNAASFLPLFEECIASNYLNNVGNIQFVAIDLVGHGHSSHRSADAQYHFIDWVYDLLLLIEHNQWQKVDLVGHSMGGMIASMFAAAFPEKTITCYYSAVLNFRKF